MNQVERQVRRRRWLAAFGAVLASASVGMAAYAAHGATGDARASLYLAAIFGFGHGVALAALAPLAVRPLAWWSLLALAAGTLLFSGSVVAAAFGWHAGLAPLGGSLLMAGWLAHAIAQWKR